MRLERLAIGGFFHFDPVTVLDLQAMPAGLIALVGQNGHGKTRLLDAGLASLYGPGVQNRAFPSRDGTLATYATSREAFIDTLWTLDGRGRVRARVNVDGQRRVAEAVLETIGADGVARPLNDGKVATFKDAIAGLFPSMRSLLASAYAAQNKRGGFGELGQKERLELFVELADLAHYEALSQTARRCQDVIETVAGRLRAALDVLRREATPEHAETVARSLADIAANAVRYNTKQLEVQRTIAARELERKDAAKAAERSAVAQARAVELTHALARADSARADHERQAQRIEPDYQAELRASAQRATSGARDVQRRREAAIEAHERAEADRQARITANRVLLGRADDVRAAMVTADAIEREISGLRLDDQATRELQDTARQRQSDLRHDVTRAEASLAELQDTTARAGLLGTVKYGDACGTDPVCPLVTDAVAARARIPDLEARAARAPAARAAIQTLDDDITVAVAHRAALATALAEAEQRLATANALAKQAPYLEAAAARIDEYERDGAQAIETLASTLAVFMAEEEALTRRKREDDGAAEERRDRLVAEAAACGVALRRSRNEIADQLFDAQATIARTPDAGAALDRLEAALAAAREALRAVDAELAGLGAAETVLLRQQVDVERRLSEAAEAERRLRTVEDEGLAWQFLARACGRDGLQRLEIDAAGPLVSDLANQLLRVGYGARFSIEIVTQVATADGKDVKEKFTILAIDNAHGGEARDIGDLSGGERVVVEEAIRAALSCYVNLRSRQRCETLWRDETLGSLDPENAPKYIAMLRKLRELSGVHQVLFVTHNLEVAVLADAIVRVHDGEATVKLPPYAEVTG